MNDQSHRRDDPFAPRPGQSSFVSMRKNPGLVSKGTACRTFGAGTAIGGFIVLINTLHQATVGMMYFTAGLLLVVGIFFAVFGKRFS
ncbi:MAG: hypothetical protein JWO96_146 [Candidatus Saccharibacteria bacterium]|nr:hypothetical protein [Candidatus Saccharibacteria bacterium]